MGAHVADGRRGSLAVDYAVAIGSSVAAALIVSRVQDGVVIVAVTAIVASVAAERATPRRRRR